MATLQGYAQLQARLKALGSSSMLMRSIGVAAMGEAKLLAPVKTSNLRHSIGLGIVTPTRVQIVAKAPYAAFVEKGTRAHEITPKAARVLRWAISSSKGFRLSGAPSSAKGNVVGYAFAARVHHPGTKAQPYL